MTSDAPTSKTSSEASEAEEGKALATQVQENGWWQGSVASDAELRSHCPELPPGATHWIVASQTCNLFNEDFEKIRLMEWVGATEISPDASRSKLRGGNNPRILHCKADAASNELHLSCDLQLRHWADRKTLASFAPTFALADYPGKERHNKQKDIFVGWIARSYTRIELSGELTAALKGAKFDVIIENILNDFSEEIYGIFLEISSDDDDELPPVEVGPPCSINISFVINDPTRQAAIAAKIKSEFEKSVADPAQTGVAGATKVPRSELAKRHKVRFLPSVEPSRTWTVADLQKTVRYSIFDQLSGGAEASATTDG